MDIMFETTVSKAKNEPSPFVTWQHVIPLQCWGQFYVLKCIVLKQ